MDPVVERVIMRCLERDPLARPGSVAQVAAALPGGDPLAAAIAAGETPSPELVAASGLKEGLRPAIAVALLAVIALGALVLVAMNPKIQWVDHVKLEKPPEALADRARDLLKRVGYSSTAVDRAYGFLFYDDFLRYVEADKKARRSHLETFIPAFFWYRASSQPLLRSTLPYLVYGTAGVTNQDPPLRWPGEIRLRLDGTGRLWSLEAIPPELDSSLTRAVIPDWALLFSEAGLDISKWRPATPQWNPNFYADTRAAWEGSFPEMPDVPLRIEGAAYRGKPVSFFIVGPWTESLRSSVMGFGTAQKVGGVLSVLWVAAVVGGGLFFARRNLRIGRGDRRGALRLATFVLALNAMSWLLVEHHVAGFGELSLFIDFASRSLTVSGVVWVVYVALEPFVRRRWPHMLVSWTRVWSGAWRDPLVGRDVLIGCAAGVASRVCIHLILLVSSDFELESGLDAIQGTGFFLSAVFVELYLSTILGLAIVFLFCFVRTLIRNQWMALVAVLILTSLASALPVPGYSPWISVAIGLTIIGIPLWVLVRFGLVSLMVAYVMSFLFVVFPMTFRSSAWYAGYGFAAFALGAAIALYGFRTSLGGRRLLDIADD